MDDTTRKAHERRIYDLSENLDRPAWGSLWDPELYARMVTHELYRDVERMAREHLTGRRVLVLGASSHDVSVVRRFTDRVAAMNISEREVEQIRDRFPEVDAFVGDAETSLGEERFDAIYCHSVLHHLHPLSTVLGALRRALKPGGVLLVAAEPGLLNPLAALARRWTPSQSHTPGERPFVFSRFHRELRHRFVVLEVRYYFLTSMVWPFVARKLPWARGVCAALLSANLLVERILRPLGVFDNLFWIVAGAYRRDPAPDD